MLQVANAMRYLHNEKIVHRDLKTSNILVEPITGCFEGYLHVKLADFGTAKPYDMTETFSQQTPGQGTPVYAAPEILFGKPMVDQELKSPNFPPKADVWSFAMVCSEILTGEPPFEGLHFVPKSGTRIFDHHCQTIVLTTYAFASLVVGKYLQKIDQTFPEFVRILCLQKQ
jgi:serine/threonine protein kinase